MNPVLSHNSLANLSRGISRDPEMFPDPEAYNPMRWLDPAYPTFKEDLTVYPTITGYSQFGYGRRVCQGQEVTEADMFVGIGSMAWLFNISKDVPEVELDSGYESEADSVLESQAHKKHKTSIDIGLQTPPNEKSIEESLSSSWNAVAPNSAAEELSLIPGAFPTWATAMSSQTTRPQTPPSTPSKSHKRGISTDSLEFIRANGNVQEPTVTSKAALTDPTLRFSPHLIAKPYPFKFSLTIRDTDRASFVRKEYEKHLQSGDFEEERVYWKGGRAGDKMHGWGQVW